MIRDGGTLHNLTFRHGLHLVHLVYRENVNIPFNDYIINEASLGLFA